MKKWKIQEESKAKVKMVFTERVQEGTKHSTYKCFHDGKTYMCVGYCRRSVHEKAQGICCGRKWVAKEPRRDNKVRGDHGVANVLGLRLSVSRKCEGICAGQVMQLFRTR